MIFSHPLFRILKLPPHILLRKGIHRIRHKLAVVRQRRHDASTSTYTAYAASGLPAADLNRYVQPLPLGPIRGQSEQIAALAKYGTTHFFDLLGSGWVQVKHGMACRGLEGHRYEMGAPVQADPHGTWLQGRVNRANLAEAQRIWGLVDAGYCPIDWQLDFKSGYRWSEDCWYRDIPYAHQPGVDVKVPWELARMQHLAQFAWAFALAKDGQPGFAAPQVYVREFQNQVLDFISTNPARFGVNWNTTMDVAIRVANWLMTYDLFQVYGAEFDPTFETEFKHSVYQHGVHIVENLEWHEVFRGNHYLSDIVGLLFVAAYLPRTPKTDVWLAFAIQELVQEVEYQFHPDGTNFESSTSYHRLAAEMVIYATALALGLPPDKQEVLQEYDHTLHQGHPPLKSAPLPLYVVEGSEEFSPFPQWYLERLEKMAEFTTHITKPNGHIPQIGDNDSGRLFKLQPVFHRTTVAAAKERYANLDAYTELPDTADYWDEDHLDHRHLVAAINGLFSREDFAAFAGQGWLEYSLILQLGGRRQFPSCRRPGDVTSAEQRALEKKKSSNAILDKYSCQDRPDQQTDADGYRHIWEIPLPDHLADSRAELKRYAYPCFGLYLYRSEQLYLTIRCGLSRNLAHAHNDQLSIELSVDGKDRLRDPGTYVYTPLPEQRNVYRSVQAHSAPHVEGREPGYLGHDLFWIGVEARASCEKFEAEEFLGQLCGRDWRVTRAVRITPQSILIIDSEGSLHDADRSRLVSKPPQTPLFSNGYGKLLREQIL